MWRKTIKLLIALSVIIISTVLFLIWFYYYNIFMNKDISFNPTGYAVSSPTTINTTEIKKDKKPNKIKDLTSVDLKIIKKNISKREIIQSTGNKLHSLLKIKKKELLTKETINKLHYLIQDKKSFYFIIKFINKSFFVFKKWKTIYYLNLWKENTNINIRSNYKEKINYIYNKADLISNGTLKHINKIIYGDNIKDNQKNSLSENFKSFLSWFLTLSSDYKLYGTDIVKQLNIRTWYKHYLYWNISLSFNVNKIIFINKLYNHEDSLWKNVNWQINNNYNDLLFINFNKNELWYIINYFFKKISLETENNFYNLYNIKIINYKEFMMFLTLDKLDYYIKNEKDNKKKFYSLERNKLISEIFHTYYRQITKFKKINPYVIKEVFYANNIVKTLPVQNKKDIERIIQNISNILIIK